MSGVVLFLIWRAQIESSHARALLQEKTATQLALARSRIDGARSAIRLPLPGSRSEVWEAMQEVLQTELPDDLRNDARDTALAAMTLPTVRTRSLTGEELETADWTLAAGDLARERWALGEYQGRVRMFSIAGGNAIAEFSTTPRKVTALIRFSPGGRWLAIRHRDELGIWDTTPGADQPMVFVAKPWGVARPFGFMQVDFAPDDGAVLWPDGDDVVATALPGGEEIGRWTARCEAIAFAPGNSVFALALDQGARVELRSWPSCEVKRIISAPASHSVEAIAVSPHAKWIALGDDTGRITVWSGNRENGRPLEFRGHTDAIRSLAFSPQGHLASSSEDGTVRLWDCSTESLILALPWEAGCLSFSTAANGLLGVGTAGQRVVCGEIGMPSVLSRFRPEGALKWPQRVSVFPDGKSLVCLSDAGPVQCALPGGAVARSYAGPDVNSVLAAPEGDGTIYGGGEQGLRRWEPDGPEAGTECLPPVEGGWGLTASANGELLGATTFNDRAFVWPASDRDASHRRELTLPDGGYFGFTISPDGTHAVATHRYEPGIVHFDTRSCEVTRKVDGFSPAHMPAWSPDGQWLVAVGTATVLWHTATWEQAPLPTLAPSLPPSVAAAFSHPAIDRDGKSRLLAVTNGGNRIAVIALPERRLIANLEAPGSQLIFDLEFSLDGHWLVAGSVRSEVQVWDLPALYALLDELGESQ